MTDFASAWQKGVDAMDEQANWHAKPTLTSLLTGIGTGTITQAQYDAVVVERDARQAAITAMKAAANADKAADAANVAGQGVLTAAGTF